MHHLVYFFCFRHFHICTILFRYYVVVILALRVPSNSVSLLHGFAPCLHTSFPICLLKSSCNSYSMSTCLMTNTLRVLESRVFLHYLINFFSSKIHFSDFSIYSLSSSITRPARFAKVFTVHGSFSSHILFKISSSKPIP